MNCGPKTIWILPLVLLLSALTLQTSRAEEGFDGAFGASKLPWYSADADELLVPTAPKKSASGVSDRNRIPAAKVKKKGQQLVKPQLAAAPAGGVAANQTFGAIGTTIIYAVGGILAAVLVGLLIYGFLKLESGDTEDESEKKRRRISDHIQHLPFELEEQDGDFETFAERALREGNYSVAVVYLFADVLVAMNEADLVRLQRGKTNRQYLNEIWEHAEIRPYYRKVMTAFEDAFFGRHEIEKSRAESCFAERPAFDAAVEKIRQLKFAASQNAASIPAPGVHVEVVS